MKNLIKLNVILFLVFAYSCGNEIEFKEKLPEMPSVDLKLESTLDTSYLINYPREMFITDSLIFVHIEDENGLCQIFNKFTGKHIGSVFKKGQGPNELTTQALYILYNEKNKILSAFDPNVKKIVYCKTDNLEKPVYKEINLANSHKGNYGISEVLQLNNGKYLTMGNTSKCRFGLLDKNKEDSIENLNIDYPKIDDDEEANWSIFTYAPQWRMKPDNTKLIAATYVGLIFEFFDFKNNKLIPSKTEYFFKPIYKIIPGAIPKWVAPTEKSRCGVSSLYTTNDNIFFVLSGYFNEETEESEFNSIFSMDWDGNFVKEYKLPKDLYPVSFVFDEKNQVFYCITMNSKEEYDFSKYSF